MHEFAYVSGGRTVRCLIPDAESICFRNIPYGRPEQIFTPAFWHTQYLMAGFSREKNTEKPGLISETVFCLLGGYGIKAEICHAVHKEALRCGIVDERETDEKVWKEFLSRDFEADGKRVKYRFPVKKAAYLARAMQELSLLSETDSTAVRRKLLQIPGIGPKTSAWIVRNCFNADDVAIIDIHIERAGKLCGFFRKEMTAARNYSEMEKIFISFADALKVKTSRLDLLMWEKMREMRSFAIKSLNSFKEVA